jgi:transposase-like protein
MCGADGIYPKGGPVDETLALLVVVGVNRKGQKKLLTIEEGYRESEESWKDLLRDLKRRGVKWIGLVIGDGIEGLWKAVREVYPKSRHQRCWVHKMRNVLDKVPRKAHDEVLEQLRPMYHAHSYNEAQALKRQFIIRYRSLYPKAIQSLLEAGEALFTYFRFPQRHWIHLKTTNPIESLFATAKLRTAAARRMRTRISAVCLIFQLLKNSQQRLRRIRGYTLAADVIDHLRSKDFKRRKAA